MAFHDTTMFRLYQLLHNDFLVKYISISNWTSIFHVIKNFIEFIKWNHFFLDYAALNQIWNKFMLKMLLIQKYGAMKMSITSMQFFCKQNIWIGIVIEYVEMLSRKYKKHIKFPGWKDWWQWTKLRWIFKSVWNCHFAELERWMSDCTS